VQVLTAVLVRDREKQGDEGDSMGDLSKMKLRIVITDNISGEVKMETRLPARFMAPITMIVPQLVCIALTAVPLW
jgi:hypothetical protein